MASGWQVKCADSWLVAEQMGSQMAESQSMARGRMALFEGNEVPDTFRISFLANSLVVPTYEEIRRAHDLSRGEYLLCSACRTSPS